MEAQRLSAGQRDVLRALHELHLERQRHDGENAGVLHPEVATRLGKTDRGMAVTLKRLVNRGLVESRRLDDGPMEFRPSPEGRAHLRRS